MLNKLKSIFNNNSKLIDDEKRNQKDLSYKDCGDYIQLYTYGRHHGCDYPNSYRNISIDKKDIIFISNDIIEVYVYLEKCDCDGTYSIECKKNIVTYTKKIKKRYKLNPYVPVDESKYKYYWSSRPKKDYWEVASEETIDNYNFKFTPIQDIFKNYFNSKYKLIESEEELFDYITSSLDCDTWCRMKLYKKMKELNFGEAFITNFADLIGNDLDKYYAMIDLAAEVKDIDTLMYLYTFKFGKNENRN